MKIKLLDETTLEFKYIYPVRSWIVTDGDTVKVTLDQGFREWRIEEPLRFWNFDAPEAKAYKKHGDLMDLHKEAGLAAKACLVAYLYHFLDVCLRNGERTWELFAVSMELDGRGRSVGDLLLARKDEIDDHIRKPISLRNSMLRIGVGRLCPTKRREPWSREELEAVIAAHKAQGEPRC